jgi:molybdate transport system substrate-binding protein
MLAEFRSLRAVLAAAVVACAALAPAVAAAEAVTVFATASLKNALDDVAAAWEEATGNEATIAYAASSALAKQIEEGAPADIFISASEDWMDAIEASGHVRGGTRRDLLGNALVLVAHGRDAPAVAIAPGFDIAGLLGGGKLAMALVDAVPAGVYGKAALTSLGVWDAVEPHVAQADNVRAALALVAAGEAPYGIVYRTDAAAEHDVTLVGTFPAGSHPPIVYPAAVTADASSPVAAAFLDFLLTPEAAARFERHGFTVLD